MNLFSIFFPAICEWFLRVLILPNCQKGDPLPLSDSSWSQIQSQDRRYSWHPFFSSQLLLQYFWFERYVLSSKALVIIYLLFNIFTLSVRSQICFVGIRNGTRYMFYLIWQMYLERPFDLCTLYKATWRIFMLTVCLDESFSRRKDVNALAHIIESENLIRKRIGNCCYIFILIFSSEKS